MTKYLPKRIILLLCVLMSLLLTVQMSAAAPQKEYWNQWAEFNPTSLKEIHYSVWSEFLKKYLVISDNQIYVQYNKVSSTDKNKLGRAIELLSAINIAEYTRNQQLAFWINLYNMETVYLILQHYPVKSIMDIGSGVFSHGPWDIKLLVINGVKLSLNDIEHRILRPIWNDPRIHAAVNCGSISCPNLQETPFDADHIQVQLNQGFKSFINSPKGMDVSKDNKINLSEIFSWYGEDFGREKNMREFIASYLNNENKRKIVLNSDNKLYFQQYNWGLNISPSVSKAENKLMATNASHHVNKNNNLNNKRDVK